MGNIKVKTLVNDRLSIAGMVNEFSDRNDVNVVTVQTHLASDQLIIAVVIYKEV